MSLVDFVTLAGTRNTDNPRYKGGDENFQAINWPPFMTEVCEKLLGYTDVHSKGAYNPIMPLAISTVQMKERIDEINNLFNNGYKLILMIDSDLIDDHLDFKSLDLHWAVLESPIEEIQSLDGNGEIFYTFDFRVYSWGKDPFDRRPTVKDKGVVILNPNRGFLRKPITWQHFMMNYNGYIKLK